MKGRLNSSSVKSLKVLNKHSEIFTKKKVVKMSVIDKVTQELKDPALTTSTSDSGMDWFAMSNESSFKNFREFLYKTPKPATLHFVTVQSYLFISIKQSS
jgi:hypothetical protein